MVAICVLVAASQAKSQGTINTAAGNGNGAFSGDGGPATFAAINHAKGMAFDASGRLYIADVDNWRVRMVNSAGVITTLAGNGDDSFSGDGGLAINAAFSDLSSVAVDTSGNLYVADSSNRRVRKVTPAGIVTTIAGIGVEGFSGDGGPATAAMLGRPIALVLDPAGNLYIADSTEQRIRKIDVNGIITTFAGNGVNGYAGDGGPAINASFAFPIGMTRDLAGNIYVADGNNERIRKITPGGIISTFAGNGEEGFAGDGGPAINATLNIPSDVAVDAAGNVYIADAGNNRVRKVDTSGNISTVAGIGMNGFAGDGGPSTQAMLNYPWGLVTDSLGNVYIADMANNRIRKMGSAALTAPPTLASSNAVVNAASFAQNAPVAAGSYVAIFGANLATVTAQAQNVPLPTTLGNTSVTFNGIPAPLYFVSSGQINAQVPFNVPAGNASIQVTQGTAGSVLGTVTISGVSPGIFVLDPTTNAGAFFHGSTFGEITSSSPAHTNEVISIYATGLGALTTPVTAGTAGPSTPLAYTVGTPTVTIGGMQAVVSFSGLAPGLVGLYQLNVTVPAGVPAGAQLLQIDIGGVLSNTATLFVAP